MILTRDMPLTTDCPWCGAKAWPGGNTDRNDHRCATDCGKPHGSDPGGSYVIHCIPGDPYDTNTETRTG